MAEPDAYDPIYRVVERVQGEGLKTKIVGSYDSVHPPISWNRRNRIYPRIQEARTYKARLAKEGRDARILKFEFVEEVD